MCFSDTLPAICAGLVGSMTLFYSQWHACSGSVEDYLFMTSSLF